MPKDAGVSNRGFDLSYNRADFNISAAHATNWRRLKDRDDAVLIQNAIKMIYSIPDGWVRMEQLRKFPGGLEVFFGVHKGKRGKKVDGWTITCRGVYETNITDFNGGGLRLYTGAHPAARQYGARRAELRWPRTCDEARLLVALYRAHILATDDWIPFDRYLLIETPWNGTSFLPYYAPVSGSNFVCRGPDFLLRAYAKAIQSIGEPVRLTVRNALKLKSTRPRVLHFGTSYIVADMFEACHTMEASGHSDNSVV